ncbi:hypothetical protein [Rhodoblastus sp.]
MVFQFAILDLGRVGLFSLPLGAHFHEILGFAAGVATSRFRLLNL